MHAPLFLLFLLVPFVPLTSIFPHRRVAVAGLRQLHHRIQRLLTYTQDFRNCELDVENLEAQQSDLLMGDQDQPVPIEYVSLYNWNGNKGWMVAEIPPLPVGVDNR